MRKLLVVSAFALATLTSGAMAAEPLTEAQLDKVTAGAVIIGNQANFNDTFQRARARARASSVFGAATALANAENENSTVQLNVD